jgi:Ala-tRNA(Pro) deacylase
MIDLESAPLPQEPASDLRVPEGEVAKSVLLEGKEQCYLAVLPFPDEIDLDRFGKIVGEPVRPAPEARLRDLFPDCELGAIPPFGRLYGVSTYADESLAEEGSIVFSAGVRGNAVRMRFQDYHDLALPEMCSFAVKGGKAPVASTARGVNT